MVVSRLKGGSVQMNWTLPPKASTHKHVRRQVLCSQTFIVRIERAFGNNRGIKQLTKDLDL